MSLKEQWEKTRELKNAIDLQRGINRFNKSVIKRTNNQYDVKKKIFTFVTDWVVLEEVITERFAPSGNVTITDRNRFVNWDFRLGTIPHKWIHFIEAKIIYRTPDDPLNEDLTGVEKFITFHVFQENNKFSTQTDLSIISHILVHKNGEPPFNLADIEAKLIITITNPHDFK